MANKSRFVIAESSIKAFFKNDPLKVYGTIQLGKILESHRTLWNLPISMNVDKFAERLINSEVLVRNNFYLEGLDTKKERYLASGATIFQIALSLVSKSFLSHYSAVFLHGLTTQVPKIIYVSFEQSKKLQRNRGLQQSAIDSAFSKPQRVSTNTTVHDDYTILVHNGMYSNRVGVSVINDLAVTNLERTLVDIAVRPDYAGGVHAVLEAYRKALDKISMNKLVATLDKFDFIYPYHQTIGFYLEKAGMKKEKLEVLKERPMENDFYLTYEIKEKEYNSDWKLYYPKGM